MITFQDVVEIDKDVAEIQKRIARINSHFAGEIVTGQTHSVLVQLQVTSVMLDGWKTADLEEWTP